MLLNILWNIFIRVTGIQRSAWYTGVLSALKTFLTKALTRNESDDSDADSSDNSDSENVESDDPEITFNQWCSTDRAELIKQTTSLSDFIELLSETFDKITVHCKSPR